MTQNALGSILNREFWVSFNVLLQSHRTVYLEFVNVSLVVLKMFIYVINSTFKVYVFCVLYIKCSHALKILFVKYTECKTTIIETLIFAM